MGTTLRGRNVALIAGHFVRHLDDYRGMTLRQIADDYGLTVGSMRTVLRMAGNALAKAGLVVSIPVREDGYVAVITNDADEHLYRLLSRLVPVTTEFARHAEDLDTLGEADFFDGLVEALQDVTEKIVDRLLTQL